MISENQARSLGKDIAEGLRYLHSKGIMHRDIKLENIMLSTRNEEKIARIADFGFSTRLSHNEAVTTALGTLGYMAPELIQEKPYSFSVDVWSFGVLLYNLIS